MNLPSKVMSNACHQTYYHMYQALEITTVPFGI